MTTLIQFATQTNLPIHQFMSMRQLKGLMMAGFQLRLDPSITTCRTWDLVAPDKSFAGYIVQWTVTV
jgi:hypothetical protein